jgi:uncharacterized protein YejL (UPF0352 family)
MILPKDKSVYRGSFSNAAFSRSGNISYLNNGPVFFANNKKTAQIYGTVVTYKTTKDLNLYNMGNLQKVLNLLNTNVGNHIQKAFLSNGMNKLQRRSNVNRNRAVARHICQMGYDGYYAPPIMNFHAEYAFCNPKSVLRYVSTNNTSNGPPPPLKKKAKPNGNGQAQRGRRLGNNW